MIPFSPQLLSLFSIIRLKSKLLANLPETASFPNAFPEQFGALDRNRLDELTRALDHLGFKQLVDYTMVSNMVVPIPAFGRLMVNKRSTVSPRSFRRSLRAKSPSKWRAHSPLVAKMTGSFRPARANSTAAVGSCACRRASGALSPVSIP
ncbi:MAG TPA: hypothetical protein VIX37_04840 [Candidatus Sulfotelmatobacter sp.]